MRLARRAQDGLPAATRASAMQRDRGKQHQPTFFSSSCWRSMDSVCTSARTVFRTVPASCRNLCAGGGKEGGAGRHGQL